MEAKCYRAMRRDKWRDDVEFAPLCYRRFFINLMDNNHRMTTHERRRETIDTV